MKIRDVVGRDRRARRVMQRERDRQLGDPSPPFMGSIEQFALMIIHLTFDLVRYTRRLGFALHGHP
jgi:hypothetical protein